MLENTAFIKSAPAGVKTTIQNAIKNFARKVREVFAMLTGGNKESRALRELKDGMYRYVDNLQKLWDVAAEEMVSGEQGEQNQQDVQQTVQYSVRKDYLLSKVEYARLQSNLNDQRYALREYGLKTIPAEDQENILARGNFVIESREDLLQRISEALTDSSIKAALFVGNVDKATRNQLERETGITLFRDLDYAFVISADCIRHIAKHFNNAAEIADAVETTFSMLKDHDSVTPQKRSDGGMNLILKKNAAEIELEAPTWISRRTRSVTVKTAYITKNNKKRANPHQASIVNNRDSLGRVEQLNNSVLQSAESVNSERQYALRDTEYLSAVEAADTAAARGVVCGQKKRALPFLQRPLPLKKSAPGTRQ